MAKNNKRWTKPPAGREVPIWEKFDLEPDEEKRVRMPDRLMLREDILYVQVAAARKAISASRMMESILAQMLPFVSGTPSMLYMRKDGKQRISRLRFPPDVATRPPRWTIHPAYIAAVKAEARRRGQSFGVVIWEIMRTYRRRFPIYLHGIEIPNLPGAQNTLPTLSPPFSIHK